LVTENLDPGKAQVAEIMSFPLIKLESQESMEKPLQVGDQAILHLVVTEHGEILGTLSINDYHKYLVLKHPK
jgi:signal-transduction protein with cAMP-binding, CBS, and nucleotidyltransferase domain